VVAAIIMWIVAFSGIGKSESPDLLSDRGWVDSAKAVCTQAQEQLAEIPNADKADSPEERAIILDQGDEILGQMIDELAAIEPDDQHDANTVDLWLKDYRTHLQDRERYSAKLAEGEDVPFTETARDNKAISKVIDKFASTNSMAECATPDDA
jgi:hypothetical protein